MGISGALAGMEEAKVAVTAEVKAAFYQLLFAQQDAQLAKENLRTVEDFVMLIRARVETKESPKFELVGLPGVNVVAVVAALTATDVLAVLSR